MKIVCLVKQVPHPSAIDFDEETKQLKRDGVPLLLNPFDARAMAQAVRLRDETGGELVAMTMGPPQAEEALRQCLALGADRCIHLSDRVFAVADTIGTSRTLAMAIEREGADVVVCGRKAIDAETAQVPPEVAAFLGRPHVTGVSELSASDGRFRFTRETDEGSETYEVDPPVVMSVGVPPETTEPPDPLADAGDRIAVWTAGDLVDDVQENDKRFGQTGSPTRVLAVRDVRPKRGADRVETPELAAEQIAALLDALEPADTSWDKPERLGDEPGASYDAWTMVELRAGKPTRLSLEVLAKGRELAGKLGGRNAGLLLGAGVGDAVEEIASRGAEVVYVADDERLADYHPEVWAEALRQILERYRPHALAIPASARGRDYGPRAAGELELGMTADCVNLGIDRAGRLIQTKPAYGGAFVSVIMGATTPQLATVRSRMFEPLEPRHGARAEVHAIELDALPNGRLRLIQRRDDSAAYELEEADVVIAVGAGVGGPAAVQEIDTYAVRIGAAVGGDREVCDAGWVARNREIGLYGRALAPRLYIAVGVNGDFEHLVGPMKAGVVAAIDADQRAPMLAAADIALVGDWRELLPTLVDALSARL